MAKAKKPQEKLGGPYLIAAFFCEKTVEDKADNCIIAIRLLDRLIFKLEGSAPADFPSSDNRLPTADRWFGHAT